MSAYSRSYWSLFHSSNAPNNDTRPKPSTVMPPSLPAGPCNYRDINQGSHANSCGCQRFWAVDAAVGQPPDQPLLSRSASANTWCFCGHHACYHKISSTIAANDEMEGLQGPAVPEGQQTALSGPMRVQKTNQTQSPRLRAALQSRVGARPASRSSSTASKVSQWAVHGTTGSSRRATPTHVASAEAQSRLPSALGLYADRGQSSISRDIHQIFEHSLPSTRNHSRSRSSNNGRDVSMAGQTTSNLAASQRQIERPGLQIPDFAPSANIDDLAQSATEVATPSNAGTPVLRGADDVMKSIKAGVDDLKNGLAQFQPVQQYLHPDGPLQSNATPDVPSQPMNGSVKDLSMLPDTDWASLGIGKLIREIASLRKALAQTPSVAASIHGLSCRVDALENFSFSQIAPVEDLNEKFEHFDGRLLEIEGKVDDLEKLRQEYDELIGSPPSTRSFSENAAGLEMPTSREAAIHRLRTIEDKLYDLEALQGPSNDLPLEVEVVMLPWGRGLKGVWTDVESSLQSSSGAHGSGNETISKPSLERHASGASESLSLPIGFDEWSRPVDDWTVPRACGPSSGAGGRTYERLHSRGFVRHVTLTDKSSRHIHSAICTAFGDVLAHVDAAGSQTSQERTHLPDGSLVAFKSAFVPLRKIHKSSRLRFLSEAELTTPLLWTAAFLDSSVFMKAPGAGLTRLYITTPLAYLQPNNVAGWTWQKLRELPRMDSQGQSVHTSSHGSTGVNEADAREPCWEWDGRLDPPVSHQTSFTSNDSFQKQVQGGSFASSHPLSPQPTELNSEFDAKLGDADESEAPFSDESDDGSSVEGLHPMPITPITENPPTSSRQSLTGRRPASLPAGDGATRMSPEYEHAQTKRAAISFDVASGLLREAGIANHADGSSVQKRRRLSRENTMTTNAGRSISGTSREGQSPGLSNRELMAGKSPRDPAQQAYATPYSWSGGAAGLTRANWHGDEEGTDVDVAMEMSDEDEDYEDDQDSDPAFRDSEEALDDDFEHALTKDEEAWEGVGDDDGARAMRSASSGGGSSSDGDDSDSFDENDDIDE